MNLGKKLRKFLGRKNPSNLTKNQKEFDEESAFLDYVSLKDAAEIEDLKEARLEKDFRRVGRIMERRETKTCQAK